MYLSRLIKIYFILWVMIQYYFSYFVAQIILDLTIESSSWWPACLFDTTLSVLWLFCMPSYLSTWQYINFSSPSQYHQLSNVILFSQSYISRFNRIITYKILDLRHIIILQLYHRRVVSNFSPMVRVDGRGFLQFIVNSPVWAHLHFRVSIIYLF